MRTADEKAKTAQAASEAMMKLIRNEKITKEEEKAIQTRKNDHDEWKKTVKTEQ